MDLTVFVGLLGFVEPLCLAAMSHRLVSLVSKDGELLIETREPIEENDSSRPFKSLF